MNSICREPPTRIGNLPIPLAYLGCLFFFNGGRVAALLFFAAYRDHIPVGLDTAAEASMFAKTC